MQDQRKIAFATLATSKIFLSYVSQGEGGQELRLGKEYESSIMSDGLRFGLWGPANIRCLLIHWCLQDWSRWYLDVIAAGDLVDDSPVFCPKQCIMWKAAQKVRKKVSDPVYRHVKQQPCCSCVSLSAPKKQRLHGRQSNEYVCFFCATSGA